MTKKKEPQNRHTFATLPEFDKAMKKIVAVPKEDVERGSTGWPALMPTGVPVA